MSGESSSRQDADFFDVAARLGMFSQARAHELQAEATRHGRAASTYCLEQGALAPIQVDVVLGLLQPGDVAPGFNVVNLLGYGGLGVVYRARQPRLDREVALKTILLSRMDRSVMVSRFEQEAKTIGRLKHPNIVAAYDYGTHQGRLYLAMELVDGIDLEKYLTDHGPISEPLTWALARQAAAGLAAAAQQDVVHRDIKPANLLLTQPPAGYPLPSGVPLVKIVDFGLAQLDAELEDRTRLTAAGTSMGTPAYMAPEQIADAHVDHRADIYALGTTVFNMLTGEAPFTGESPGQLMVAKLKGDQSWLDRLSGRVSDETVQLLRVMTAQEPEDRCADYDVLLAEIDRIGQQNKLSDEAGDTSGDGTGTTVVRMLIPPAPRGPELPKRAPSAGSIDIGLAVTSEFDTPGTLLSRRRLHSGLLIVPAVLVAVVAAGALLTVSRAPAFQRLQPTGREQHLFNGENLNGWRRPLGAWKPTMDEEGAYVLSGKGSIQRPLPWPAPGDAWQNFGIRINVDLLEATQVSLQFDHEDLMDDARPRSVLQLTRDGATLARQARTDANVTGNRSGPASEPQESPNYDELRIERHETLWLALLNGQEVGRLPVERNPPWPAIQLVIAGGQAYCEGMSIYELAPPTDE